MKYIPLVARAFLAVIFLRSGISKILGFAGTAEMMGSVGLPIPEVLLVGTIAFQILGGLSVLLGYKVRIGAILLILFLIPATLVFHNPTNPDELNNFFKNLSLIGGLLMVFYFGAGAASLEGSSSRV